MLNYLIFKKKQFFVLMHIKKPLKFTKKRLLKNMQAFFKLIDYLKVTL